MKTCLILSIIVLSALLGNTQNSYNISECMIEKGVLKTVVVSYNRTTGAKTMVQNGVTVDYDSVGLKSKEYAANSKWYINNEPIKFKGRNYVKYGLPRILGVNEIEKIDTYEGVNVYVESGLSGNPEVLYIPVRHGCEFQPYQKEKLACGKVTITPSLKSVKVGKDVKFTATVANAKETLSYSWHTFSGTIKGSKTGKSVIINTTGAEGETIEVYVDIKGKECVANGTKTIKIIK